MSEIEFLRDKLSKLQRFCQDFEQIEEDDSSVTFILNTQVNYADTMSAIIWDDMLTQKWPDPPPLDLVELGLEDETITLFTD